MGNVTVAVVLRMALSSGVRYCTDRNRDFKVQCSRPTKFFEAKAKSPIGGGGDAEGVGQMKSQQMRVGNGGVCKKKKQSWRRVSLSQGKKKTGHLFPPLLSLLVMGREERGGAKGPDSAK